MGSHSAGRRVLSDSWPAAAIGVLAGRQKTLITHAQLVELGVHVRTISRAVTRSWLYRVHPRVYSLVPSTVQPTLAAEFAAVLAHGPDAVLSHQTAARLHGLAVPLDHGAVHVTLRLPGRRSCRSGVVVHRTAGLPRPEHHRLHGLPVASVARTVLDLCPHLDERPLELLVDEVLVHKKTSRTKLDEALRRHAGQPGTARLKAALDPGRTRSLTRSPREERLFQMLRSANVPMPEVNIWLTANYRPDLLWRDRRVIVEYDGEEWHMGRSRFHNDRTRRNDLTATEGYQVLHVTKEHTPEQVLVWIAQALARGERN